MRKKKMQDYDGVLTLRKVYNGSILYGYFFDRRLAKKIKDKYSADIIEVECISYCGIIHELKKCNCSRADADHDLVDKKAMIRKRAMDKLTHLECVELGLR